MSWRTDTIQAVIFVPPGANAPDALAAWQCLFKGVGPDSFQRPHGSASPISTAAGQVDGSQLQITSQFGRIDLQLTGIGQPEQGPPQIADRDGALKIVSIQMAKLAAEFGAFRFSIVLGLSQQVEEGAVSAQITARSGAGFPADAEDCIYQYNLKRRFKVEPEFEMNRILTWASGHQQMITFSIDQGQGGSISPMTIKSIPIISLKIDVNSATAPPTRIDKKAGALAEEICANVMSMAEGAGILSNG